MELIYVSDMKYRGKEALIDKFRSSSIVCFILSSLSVNLIFFAPRWTNAKRGAPSCSTLMVPRRDSKRIFLHPRICAGRSAPVFFRMSCIRTGHCFITLRGRGDNVARRASLFFNPPTPRLECSIPSPSSHTYLEPAYIHRPSTNGTNTPPLGCQTRSSFVCRPFPIIGSLFSSWLVTNSARLHFFSL